jgi:uridine kinase
MGQRTIVTVDGLDGSGKSIFAARLAVALGAIQLAVDDFRRPVDWARADRNELDLYYDQRYDLADLDRCLQAFTAGASGCDYHPFDGAREVVGEPRRLSFEGRAFLIAEGVFVARLAAADRAVAVYLDIPREEAWRRVVARDMPKGRTEEEVRRRIERRYLPAHERYLASHRPQDRAHLVIDNRDPLAPRLLRVQVPAGGGGEAVREAVEKLLDSSFPEGG